MDYYYDEINRILKSNRLELINKNAGCQHGTVHKGFRGLRRFVTRKKGGCKLIGNRFALPHDAIL